LAIPRSCANCASNESQRLRASRFQPSLRRGRELHASLMNGPRLFPPKFQLTLHHELEAHARLSNTLFRTKYKRSTAALYFRECTTDLNRPQIVRSSHDVLCEDRDPLHSTAPFRRHTRRGRRWWGEEVTQKRGIRDEHGFQNGQERRASVWPRNILQGEGLNESKEANKRRTGRGILWVQLMTAPLLERGDRLFKLECPSYIS
jgi:hypothetical protein